MQHDILAKLEAAVLKAGFGRLMVGPTGPTATISVKPKDAERQNASSFLERLHMEFGVQFNRDSAELIVENGQITRACVTFAPTAITFAPTAP